MSDSAQTHSHHAPDAGETASFDSVEPAELAPVPLPERIGRYRVERVLGSGGFGIVYLAHDAALDRPVAIKVPRAGLLSGPLGADAYLTEARTVAGLDHPNIVPVHDIGGDADFPCYIVSKYVDGTTLAACLLTSRPAPDEIGRIVSAVAEAVHYAHTQGVIHRDIKPGNIVLDRQRKPYLADFGLALRERDLGRGAQYAGTPAYMSPEQARGEGHRVDGRSDVFSLGVVLYELLTGHRPFTGHAPDEVLAQIVAIDPRPLRQIDETVPVELERICLKALAKRVSDRYATANEMADELRSALGEPPAPRPAADHTGPVAADEPVSTVCEVAVVPKGLRAFDAADADFFLDLLPGPRDRHGLPEAVRFWKTRIEQTDPDGTFPVGLLYGPSGCGKSSLVKAGLLSRLGPHVKTIYLEATDDLEVRLLDRLGRMCPEAACLAELPLAFAAVRRGPPGEKVLVVLDQFEQWLHARRDGGDELVRALRQCDGGRIQCLILVRGDFWMPAARFMRELEVPVVEGHNAASVDLFDPAHARKVLTAFGQAYGALPARAHALTPDQSAFLDRAVAELAQDGRVIPVRLALFADLVKSRPWTGHLLDDLGGAVGIGVTFLDENFAAATAPPEHRYHRDAVRAVLGALLPAVGTDIRSHTRTREELLEASGYAQTPTEFDGLMRVLIGETRLLTPVATDAPDPNGTPPGHEARYQLTHDYLVPSIRDWLTRKRMETRRGRAELRLAERAALWHAKPEVRQLPSLTEWLAIRLLTRRRTWTEPQQRMMHAAGRRHLAGAARAAVVVALLTAAAVAFRGWIVETRAAAHADALVHRLLDADAAEIPRIVDELTEYRGWTDPALERVVADPTAGRARHLRARLGLLPADPRHADELGERLLDADPNEFPVVRDALAPHSAGSVERLWTILASERDAPDRRFRAAAALASYAPADPRWERASPWTAEQLVAQPSLVRPRWVEALRPVKDRLVPPLAALVRDRAKPAGAAAAAEILGDYAADRPDVLIDPLADAIPDAFAHLFAALRTRPDRAVPALTALFDVSRFLSSARHLFGVAFPVCAAILDRTPFAGNANVTAGRQANIAIALLRLGAGDRLWPLLKASPDPRVRSFVIDRLAPLGCAPSALVQRLEAEPNDTVRAAVWLGLGGYDERALPPADREALTPTVLNAYHEDDSAAVHAAAWWLLGKWGARDRAAPRPPTPDGPTDPRRGWYVNKAGQTMVRFTGPVEFMMGSPPGEPDNGFEKCHRARIGYSFDIGMTEVTIDQYNRFLESRKEVVKPVGPSGNAPVTKIFWYDAAAYCNWLSEAEGLPRDQWCYETNAEGRYAAGMKIKPNYPKLKGYRLPAEREWEFACRAGAATRRCYGDGAELLPRYAWFAANAGDEYSPVARLLPNSYGLFDMHGNTSEWCQAVLRPYGDPATAALEAAPITDETPLISRGGHTNSPSRLLRSATRFADQPRFSAAGGFRLARSNP